MTLTSKQSYLTLRGICRYIAILNQGSGNLALEMRTGIWKFEGYIIIVTKYQLG